MLLSSLHESLIWTGEGATSVLKINIEMIVFGCCPIGFLLEKLKSQDLLAFCLLIISKDWLENQTSFFQPVPRNGWVSLRGTSWLPEKKK